MAVNISCWSNFYAVAKS